MKTLIVYHSKNGATKRFVQQISKKIDGTVVTITPDKKLNMDILEFDFILLAAPVYYGFVNKKINQFINFHRPELLHKNIAFAVMGNEKKEKERNRQLDSIIEKDIQDHALFYDYIGSAITLSKITAFERFFLKFLHINEDFQNYDNDKIENLISIINNKNKKLNI